MRWGFARKERSTSGDPILRHTAADRPFTVPTYGPPGLRDALEGHLVAHLGPCDAVWHEIVSDLVHLDVFMWAPTDERPMYTFVTVGMSDLPMTLPRSARREGRAERAELMLCLQPDWPVPDHERAAAPWDDPDAWFPIEWLKRLARLPHDHRTWVAFGHTIPNDDPPQRLAATTQLCGWVLLPPMTLPKSFWQLDAPAGRIDLFGIIALHRDEMEHKLAHGVEALFDGFDRHQVSELLAVDRPSSLA